MTVGSGKSASKTGFANVAGRAVGLVAQPASPRNATVAKRMYARTDVTIGSATSLRKHRSSLRIGVETQNGGACGVTRFSEAAGSRGRPHLRHCSCGGGACIRPGLQAE